MLQKNQQFRFEKLQMTLHHWGCTQTSLAGGVSTLVSSVLFRGFIKRRSETFFDFFCEKGKGRSCDKYAVLQLKWYEFFRQVSGDHEVNEIVTDCHRKVRMEAVCSEKVIIINNNDNDNDNINNIYTGSSLHKE